MSHRPISRSRRGISGAGCLFALVLLVVVGGLLALRSRGRDTRADRLSHGRWRPERAAAYGECEMLARLRFAERGMTATFPPVAPTARAMSSDGRTFVVEAVADVHVGGSAVRHPFRCVLERDAAVPGGWRRVSGPD